MYRITTFDENGRTATATAQDFDAARELAMASALVDGSANVDWVDEIGAVSAGYVIGPKFTDDGEYVAPLFVKQGESR